MTPKQRADVILGRFVAPPPNYLGLPYEVAQAIEAAVLAEREACAKLVEGIVDNPDVRVTLNLAANAIRGR